MVQSEQLKAKGLFSQLMVLVYSPQLFPQDLLNLEQLYTLCKLFHEHLYRILSGAVDESSWNVYCNMNVHICDNDVGVGGLLLRKGCIGASTVVNRIDFG